MRPFLFYLGRIILLPMFKTVLKIYVIAQIAYLLVVGSLMMIGKTTVPDKVLAAIDGYDRAALEERVDWDDLRAYLLEDLTNQARLMKSARLPGGIAPSQVEPIVTHYVQPENLEMLFTLKRAFAPDIPAADFLRETSIAGPASFKMVFSYPRSAPKSEYVPAALRVEVIFHLDWFTWKVDAMEVPAPIVPKRIVTAEQVVAKFGGVLQE